MNRNPLMTIPNILTFLRLLLLPVVVMLFRGEHYAGAALLFLGAVLTDPLDGYLARRLNQQTRLGMYLDPLTDKIIILSLFYELALSGIVPTAAAHLLLARELLHSGIRSFGALSGKVVGANWMGKTKAVLQSALLTLGLGLPAVVERVGDSAAETLCLATVVLAWAVVAVSWCFFAVFAWWNRRLFTSHAN
jgi:CDP-diacylglycerol--glycerol-3-phosphate 3-phosphatidyltransferase